MSRIHRVQPGDGISRLAEMYGLAPETIRDHPDNAALGEKRTDWNALHEGDEVVIPDLGGAGRACATGKKHVFRRHGVPAKYRLQILEGQVPVAGAPYRLIIDGQPFEGDTDADGVIDHFVPPGSRAGTLEVLVSRRRILRRKLTFALAPVNEIVGVQQRLANLGYLGDAIAGVLDDATFAALQHFQARHGLDVTGENDDATQAKLDELHGTRKTEPVTP